MVGQVQFDPRDRLQPIGAGSGQGMGMSGPSLHGPGRNLSNIMNPRGMMIEPHPKGLGPPRSPRRKAPPPTIMSPSGIQRNRDGVDVSSIRSRAPDNMGPALERLGKSISLSVEILSTIGETIADENPDIRADMLQACRESRVQSGELDKMCEALSLSVNIGGVSSGLRALGVSSTSKQTIINNHSATGSGSVLVPSPGVPCSSAEVSTLTSSVAEDCSEIEVLVRTLRQLLTPVTKILLLADNVVVKQLLGKNIMQQKTEISVI